MFFRLFITIAAIALFVVVPAFAEDEEKIGWSTTAEVGIIATSGNSETQTLSFKDETIRRWEKSSFRIKAGALRAETTTTTPEAVQLVPAGPIVINEPESKATNAEAYYFEGRYNRKIHDKFFWFAGAGWDQNRPAGIDSRTTAFGGVGNLWRDDDKIKWGTDYALSYTDQEDVNPSPNSVGDYAGLRVSWIYRHKFTESTEYFNDFVVDVGLDNSDNWRADMLNAVAVTISKKLALKVSLQHMYNNLPPIELLTVVDGGGVPVVPMAQVSFELDELDTLFGATLVVSF
jgi:putative salt-induced outer membrane protein YdiY